MSRFTGTIDKSLVSLATPQAGLSPVARLTSAARLRILVSAVTFAAGCIGSTYAYDSFAPTLVAVLSLLASLAGLVFCGAGHQLHRQAFVQVFCVCWFWAAIAAAITMSSEDFSDAIYFYDEVTSGAGTAEQLADTLFYTENGGAIVLWRSFYNAFTCLGIPEAPYIGVTLNICLVAATCVVGIKICFAAFGPDPRKAILFTRLFTVCGIFWLYAAIHIRDAAVLFVTSILTLAWIRFLARRSIQNGVLLAVVTVALLQLFSLLRQEFFYVPIAMGCAGTAALGVATQRGSKLAAILILATAAAIFAQARWSLELQDDAVELADINRYGYSDLSRLESQSDSLGSSLIMSQPLPLRVVMGSVYVLIFPIPCWVGFQQESAYHLFKSLHVLFMYATLPLVALAFWRLWQSKPLRTPQTVFLVFTVSGFLASVSYTSLETRHFGAFLTALLVLAVLPDLTQQSERRAYRRLLTLFGLAMFGLHLAWLVLKGGI